jgi:hypothetical protein
MPPVIRPKVSYGNDTHIQVNNVRGKLFRFSYRYKYFDNTYSKYSAFSDITLPEESEIYNGEVLNSTVTNNYIKISINAHSPALVKEIEIVAQETTGDWKRVKIINRQEQAELTTFDMSFNFYNNESYLTVTNIEVATVSDYVPQRANSMEIINKNILTYGGCLEGFDNIPKDEIRVGLTPVLQSIYSPPIIGATRRNNIPWDITDVVVLYDGNPIEYGKGIDIGSWWPGTVVAGDVYVVTIDGKTNIYTVTANDVAHTNVAMASLIAFLSDNYSTYGIRIQSDPNLIDILSLYGNPIVADITQSLFCVNGGASNLLTKKSGFKTGANHPFCIFYYDDNLRRWDAQVSKENVHIFGLEMHGTTVYVPMLNEVSPPPDDTSYKWTIDWEVYHQPPVGARYWRWGYAGNSLCSKMVQYIVSDVTDGDPATDGANLCKVNITPLQTLKSTITADWNQYPNSIIDTYTWKTGDRIRFITKKVVSAGSAVLGDIIDGVYEYEILKQSGDDSEFIFIQGLIASNGITAADIGENSLAEIYSPLATISETQTVYYEFGDMMPIREDSAGVMVHYGQNGIHNQDTVLSHTAMGSFDSGDVYHIMRTPSKPIDTDNPLVGFFHESQWYSDFYESTDFNKGKIGFETNFGQRFLNIVRYSRPYFQNTEINGLSTFEEDDANNWPGYKEYNDIFGDIVAIYEFGDTLKVYQERKPSSTLVGRQEWLGANGEPTVAVSDVVLGAIRYDKSNYSTIFPESLSRNNNFIYGFDIYNGAAWRDGNNGIFPISGRYTTEDNNNDYKMQTYFKLKAKALMESGISHVSVLTVWDEEYKLLYVIFKDSVIQDNNETIVFHEPSNRWITFTEFDQTSINGFNTPLEFFKECYIIVKGFENGIGFSFDYDTRFAHFNLGGGLGTTALTLVNPEMLPIEITMPTPQISSSPLLSTMPLNIVLTLPLPDIGVSWVHNSNPVMIFAAEDHTSDIAQITYMDIIGNVRVFIGEIPNWITVWNYSGRYAFSAGDDIFEGEDISIFPNSVNTSFQRTVSVIFADLLGNISTVSVTQEASVIEPLVVISKNPLDTTDFLIYPNITSGSCYVGDNTVSITFSVHKSSLGTGMPLIVYYVITRDGVYDEQGELSARDGIQTAKIISLSSNAIASEVIIVYLSGIPVGSPTGIMDVNISAGILPLVITLPTPIVSVSWITVSNDTMNWTALQYGSSQKRISIVSVVGTWATLQSFPSWITIVENSEGSIIEIGDTISDGETIALYPKNINTLPTIISGFVSIIDNIGNISTIQVTQQASLVNPDVRVWMNPSDTSGITLSGAFGTAAIGSKNINITFTPNDPYVGNGGVLNLEYQIWKNTIQVGGGNLMNLSNKKVNTKLLTMSSIANAGDIITVYLNESNL